MDLSQLIIASFALGLSQSTFCASRCLPTLIPYLGCEDHSLRSGLITTGLYTLGRLGTYLLLGVTVFIGFLTFVNPQMLGLMVVPLGIFTIVYGLLEYVGRGNVRWCPIKGEGSSPLVTILLGVLVGALLCPPLFIAILFATSAGVFNWVLLSIVSFWAGISIWLLPVGAFSGLLFGRLNTEAEKLRKVFGLVLVLIGLSYVLGIFF